MIIFKGEGQYLHWHLDLSAEDKDTVFAHSKKGWTNQVLGVEYLKLIFDPQTKTKVKDNEWRMLIVDGHNSHFSTEFIQYCEANKIALFCIPPHTTHILQPLDVGLFAPLQHHYSRGIEQHMRRSHEAIHKGNFHRYASPTALLSIFAPTPPDPPLPFLY